MESDLVPEQWIVLGISGCNIWKCRVAKTREAAEAMAKDFHDTFGFHNSCCFRNFTEGEAHTLEKALHLSGE